MPLMNPDPPRVEPSGAESIESLFAALESPLLSYGLRLAGNRETAEDIVQEAFMKLHEQFAEVREPRRWLYRTVHNLALNHLRRSNKVVSLTPPGREEDPTTPEISDPQPLPDEQIARWEGIGQVRLCLKSLDERSRMLVQLKFTENLSYKEISSRTGLTVGHVGYLLHHALKTIAGELARNGIVP
jgi:RNA polymerase sigma-70 factor (ECF subfamily)